MTNTISSSEPAHLAAIPTPAELAREFPLSDRARRNIEQTRAALSCSLRSQNGKHIAIVGPCSIHSEAAALAYAERLQPVAQRLSEHLIVVMRAYFEKPRTTVGWKGFLYDPGMDGSHDLSSGLRRSRHLAVQLSDRGLPVATEILDPLVAPYLQDCLSWVAIGARTTESQIHRQLASGLPCPVGFKNSTDGSADAALAAMQAAATPHTQLGIGADGRVGVRRSPGNRATHVVLRGGRSGPNYDRMSIDALVRQTSATQQLKLLVDCSHANCGKQAARQVEVAEAVFAQLDRSDARLLGVMLESHLRPGKQEPGPLARDDMSVTDPCLGFDQTERLLELFAAASARSRGQPGTSRRSAPSQRARAGVTFASDA